MPANNQPVINRGRLINFVNGITGVTPGGNAVVNMPVNMRYHRNVFQCTAVNYTGGTGLTTTTLTGSGTGATVTPTVTNGVITAAAVVAGGSGYVTGDTITVVDATGTGAVLTVTAAAGAVTALAVANGGTPSAVSPATLLTGVKQLVNGINMRDITPDSILRTVIAEGYYPSRGELPLFYTSPDRNVNQQNEVTSWDLFGQSTFQIQFQISPNVSTPGISGISEFDYMRNVQPGQRGAMTPFLQPMSQHQFSLPIVAGRNDINTLPYTYPISRMWLLGSTPGSLTQLEVYQDSNKVFEATLEQMLQAYEEYGFNFGQPDFVNSGWATTAALQSAYQQPLFFDMAFVSDPDERWWKALKCVNQMILRVYSSVAQTLTIVQETLPGAYAA